MKKRVIVLDTNGLIHYPESPLHFANENVVIAIKVVEEVDRFKRDPEEKGFSIFQSADTANGALNLIKKDSKKN